MQQKEDEFVAAKDKQRQWYVNGQGQTFVVLDGGDFEMGSPRSQPGRNDDPVEIKHKRTIAHRFAIGSKEITRAEFHSFIVQNGNGSADIEGGHLPVTDITFYQAAAYCNWLSRIEEIPESDWCYMPNLDGEYGPGMTRKATVESLRGYRLPTEAEWEFACRGGTDTGRFYGWSETLLTQYAWVRRNSNNQKQIVGQLKPNDFGLFDIHGNVVEWVD